MKRWVPGLVLGLSVVAGSASAQTVSLRLSHWLPTAHPMHIALSEWTQSLNKASEGAINVTIFHSEQIGKAFDHYDMVRDGIADVALINPGYQPGRFPVSSAAEMPFMIADSVKGTIAVDKWYRKYAAAEMKDVVFCTAFLRPSAIFQSRTKPIRVPADIKGMRIRPPDGTVAALVTSLGGTNVQASAPESREVLERGVADATVFPWGSTVLFGVDKALKYHLDMPAEMGFFGLAINKGRYEKLNAAQKKAMDAHCTTEWAAKLDAPWSTFEDEGKAKIEALAGHEIIKPTPEQVDLWRQSAKPLIEEWSKAATKAGVNATQAFDELKALLAAEKAAL